MKKDRRATGTYTTSIPAAGRKYYGIGRNASYRRAVPCAEAKLGDIPTVTVGGLKLAVVQKLERMLAGEESK